MNSSNNNNNRCPSGTGETHSGQCKSFENDSGWGPHSNRGW